LSARVIQASDNFNDERVSYNSSGVDSSIIGMKVMFPTSRKITYGLEGYYRYYLFENSTYNESNIPSRLALGDDTYAAAVGLNFQYESRTNDFFSGKLFYKKPAEYLSSEYLLNLEYVMAWRTFAIGAGFESVISRNLDSYTDDPENRPLIYTGESEYFNSVNRGWHAPHILMNIRLGPMWRLESKVSQVISGNSTDLGPQVLIQVARRKEIKNIEYEKKNAAFKQYRVQGEVTKLSNSRKTCLIDKGIQDGLDIGMKVDFYHFDFLEGQILIASGIVTKARSDKALVTIKKRFSKKRLEVGTIARSGRL
jgi:hypothetical protein